MVERTRNPPVAKRVHSQALARCMKLATLAALLLRGLWVLGTGRLFSERRQQQRMMAWSASILQALDVTLRTEGDWPAEACLLSSNHISWIDTLLISSRIPAGFIAKSQIRRWPLIGRFVGGSGGIFIERRDIRSLDAGVRQAAARLAAGKHVCWFPEGTTTDGFHLRNFTATFFQAAIDAGSPVVPVAVRYSIAGNRSDVPAWVGNESFWKGLLRVMDHPGLTADLRIGMPIPTRGEDQDALARKACQQVALLEDLQESFREPIAPRPVDPESPLYRLVVQKLEAIVETPIHAQSTFGEIELDSLSALPLLFELENFLGRPIDDSILEVLHPSATVAEFVATLEEMRRA